MATQDDVKKLERGLKAAYEKGEIEKAKAIGTELVRLQQQEQVDLAKLEASVQASKPPRPTALDLAKDIVVSPIKGAAESAAGLIGFPGAIQQGVGAMFGKDISQAPASIGAAPMAQYQDIINLIEKLPGAKRVTQYEAKTPLGKPLETLAEFVAPSLPFTKPSQIGGAERMLRALKIGGAAAVPAYAFEDNPYASIPLSILAGGATAFATAPSRAAEAARAVLKDVSPQEIELAKEVQKQAQEFGIPMTAPELIDSKLLQDLGSVVYGTEKGGEVMFNYIKNRPEKIKEVAADLLDQISKNPESLRGKYKNFGEVAADAIKNARAERTKKSQVWYKIANDEFVDENQVLSVIDKIDDTIKNLDKGDPTRAKLANLKRSLIKKEVKPELILDELNQPIQGQSSKKIIIPQTNVNTIDNILKRFNDMVADSNSNIAKERNFIEKNSRRLFNNEEGTGVLNLIDDTLRTNPNYSKAKDVYRQLSDDVVQPVLDNIAPLAKGGVTPALVKRFIFNPDNNNVNDIRKTYEILNKTDPNAFPDIVRSYVKAQVNKKLIDTKSGESLASGFNLWKVLAGTDEGAANFNTALKGVAEAQGANANNVVLGFQKFNEVLKRTARLANVDNPKAAPSSQFLVRDIAQIGSFMWHVKFAAKAERYVKNKTIEDLSNIFSQKNSIELLEKLAKINPGSNEAQALVRRILYVTNNLKTQEERDREAMLERGTPQPVQPQVATQQ
jgi:hypothetical protein